MASLGQSFDPNAVKPDTGAGGGLHPIGIFEFEIQESEVKPTSNGKGTILAFQAVGTGNPDAPSDNKGKKVFVNINIQHESVQAQTIGQGQLSALCAAIGFTESLQDSEQLHYQPFWAEIVHTPRMSKESGYKEPDYFDDGTPKMNAEIKRFMFGDGEAAPAGAQPPETKAQPQQAAAPDPAPPPAGGAPKRTWQKKAA